MLTTTTERLRCPRKKRGADRCGGLLTLRSKEVSGLEVHSGQLDCQQCKAKFPILAGVAIVVPEVRHYLVDHAKGIAQVVKDADIPREYLQEYLAAKAEIHSGHIEDDLEAERVTSLYIMNHYLHAGIVQAGTNDPLIGSLIREHWDQGPFAQIARWMEQLSKTGELGELVELGCGVGGIARLLGPRLKAYLGVDSSFASIAWARHLALGAPHAAARVRIPEDLLRGPVSREVQIPPPESKCDGRADFIVGDIDAPPLERGSWDISLALNAIDMLEEPDALPKLQFDLLKKGGLVLQSCPYIWHEVVAKRLRGRLPREVRESARAAEWLYEQAGFAIAERAEHVPWLFFKHARQLEIYSVHMFWGRRK